MKSLVAWCCLSAASTAGAETAAHNGSIHGMVADLTIPPVTQGDPAAGRRVTAVTPGWQQTDVRHVLYLPHHWRPGRAYPVIV